MAGLQQRLDTAAALAYSWISQGKPNILTVNLNK